MANTTKNPPVTPASKGGNFAKSREKLLADIKKIGLTGGNGVVARAEFYQRTCKAAQEGVVDANSEDPATLYRAYAEAYLSAAKGDGKESTTSKVRISELRQGMEAAQLPEPVDFVEVLNRAYLHHQETAQSGAKVKTLWQGFVDCARMQKDADHRGTSLSDEDIKVCFEPKVREAKTVSLSDFYQGMKDAIDAVIAGEHRNVAKDQSDATYDVLEAIDNALTALNVPQSPAAGNTASTASKSNGKASSVPFEVDGEELSPETMRLLTKYDLLNL